MLDVGDVIFVVAVGAVIGDSIGYELGCRLGRDWLLHYGRWVGLRERHLKRADDFFAKHGGKTIFIGRFIGFLRALAPFVAGSSKMPYRSFLIYNAAGGILWSIVIVLLGYFLGASWHRAEVWIGRASAIVGGTILFVILLVWLWRQTVRREDEIKEGWRAFLENPRVAAFRRRFASQLVFLQERFSPASYLGLNLTVGVAILVGACWLFGGIAEDVVNNDRLTTIDFNIANWLHDHAAPTLDSIMLFITYLGSTLFISFLALAAAVWLAWQKNWYRLTELVLIVPGGMLVNVLLKHAFHRVRPTFDNPILTLTTYSFPSGHATAAMLLYGAFALFAIWKLRAWRWKLLAGFFGVTLIALIDFSRIYLGVHYLSDVLAGSAVGIAWLALVITAVETMRPRRLALQPPGAGKPSADEISSSSIKTTEGNVISDDGSE